MFGKVDVKYAKLEHKINRLDEREAMGNWSGNWNEEKNEARRGMIDLLCQRFQIDSQKAKVRWLREMDQNSKFFNAMLNHGSRTFLDKLELEDGAVVMDERQIVDSIVSFYSN